MADDRADKLYAYNVNTRTRDPWQDFNTLERSRRIDHIEPPFGAGLHYYGACVEPVAGESDFENNCSSSVAVTVTERDSPAGESKLYWTDWGTDRIQRANLDGSGIEDLIVGDGLDGPDGLALDMAGGKIYWTDSGASRIQRANLDGSAVEDLVTGLGIPYGLALDMVGGKMYWSDRQASRIQRSDLDGANVEDLITSGLVFPGELELDIDSGKMYWTNPGSQKIQRANFDGSHVEDLVASGLGSPTGLALDVSVGKIYWSDRRTDMIQRANLDGSAIEDLVTGGLDTPNGLALDVSGGKMYWADAGTDRIQRADLDGSDVETLVSVADGLVDPSDVAVGGAAGGNGSGPDLIVERITVDDGNPYAGTYLKLSARVRNQGDSFSDRPTIIYYRSSDETISTADARIGTGSIWGIQAFSDVEESIHLIVPSEAGTYYYGACVESVHGESDTANNCSRSVAVTVTSPPPFDIEIVFRDGFRDASHQELFRRAALRWMALIAEDIPDVDFSSNPFHEVDEDFGMRIRVDDVVDDLRIYAGVGEIDGKGRVLGHARPVIVDSSSGLPKIGLIKIDKDDISSLFESHLLATMIHEIGHVLGFGTLWARKELLRGDSDLHFTGPLAIQAFDDAGGETLGGPKVPVESDAGHWRQSVFGFELMTRSFPGGRLILSAITIQSLADLGYRVNVSRADEYRLPDPAGAKPVAGQVLDWGDCVSDRPVYVVDENGRVVDVDERR